MMIDQNAITAEDTLTTIRVVLYDSEYSYYGLKTSVFFTVSVDYVIPIPVVDDKPDNTTEAAEEQPAEEPEPAKDPEPETVEEELAPDETSAEEETPEEQPTAEELISESSGPSAAMGASKADWENKADPAIIANLWKALEERQQMLENLNTVVVAPPVDLFIQEITRNGIVRVEFN